ncbi:YbaB/EbfC family nucleoid-associated protein [Actinokineospora enzanensis]|uniref:YbaB/EbfC family nucleoid-associated protein n=1 Tax=Actinokineospora enzanensis TaxID=155975 RepID=UPI0003621195|nr:YbaB/EbfC family nucleoid-associated protein [Actinokineospora enzanensis]
MIRDPQEWVREQEQRTATLLAKAENAQAMLAENSVTATSPDRAVTVTVNPGGGLTSLVLAPEAERLSHQRLSALIMTTYTQAARQAAARTMEIMSGLVGGDSEALDIVRQAMPELPDPDPAPDRPRDDDDGFGGVYGGRR